MAVNEGTNPKAEFETGALKEEATGKGRFDLIPPVMLKRLAIHYELGAKKYEPRNWEKGIPTSKTMDAALRHLNQYREGMRDEDHLAAALFNITSVLFVEEMVARGRLDASLHDMPSYIVQPGDLIIGAHKDELGAAVGNTRALVNPPEVEDRP